MDGDDRYPPFPPLVIWSRDVRISGAWTQPEVPLHRWRVSCVCVGVFLHTILCLLVYVERRGAAHQNTWTNTGTTYDLGTMNGKKFPGCYLASSPCAGFS